MILTMHSDIKICEFRAVIMHVMDLLFYLRLGGTYVRVSFPRSALRVAAG